MKCPNCGTRLTIEENLDGGHNTGDDEMIWQDVMGSCETCGRKYLWTQHYTLVFEDSLEEDE